MRLRVDALQRSRARQQAGFTLTELVVVLVIMGIMAAMIIPQMQGTYEDALLRSSSRKIISALTLAYAQTVSKNQSHRLRLDSRKGKYLLEKKVRGSNVNDGFVPVRDLGGAEGEIDTRISIELRRIAENTSDENPEPASEPLATDSAGPVDAITFYPDGTADGTEILLQDRAGFKLLLQVSPVTGHVEILEPEPK